MNTQERQYLFREKRSEGKDDMKANQEIMDLIQAQRLFKKMKIEMKYLTKTISTLEKDNEKLKNKVKEEKNKRRLENLKNQKDFTSQVVNETLEKNNKCKQATINHASRVINFTEVGKEYTRTDLSRMLVIPIGIAEMLFLFLNRYTIAKFEKLPGGRYRRTQ